MEVTKYPNGTFALVIIAPDMSQKRRRKAGTFIWLHQRSNSICKQASYLSLMGPTTTTTAKVLTNFQRVHTTNAGCSLVCNNQNSNFYGVVNAATCDAGLDCCCGDTIISETIAGLESGAAPESCVCWRVSVCW